MSIHKLIGTPRDVTPGQLEIIGKMYPYGTYIYKDLKLELAEFLRKKFSDFSNDAQVIAISQHNGRGRQWGVVLIKRCKAKPWQLAAQFGHGVRVPFTQWHIESTYFFLLKYWLVSRAVWIDCPNHAVSNPMNLGRLTERES